MFYNLGVCLLTDLSSIPAPVLRSSPVTITRLCNILHFFHGCKNDNFLIKDCDILFVCKKKKKILCTC